MRRINVFFILIFILGARCSPASAADAGAASPPPAASAEPSKIAGTLEGLFEAFDRTDGKIVSQLGGVKLALTISDPDAMDTLARARPGDIVKFTADDIRKPSELVKLLEVRRPVRSDARIASLAATFAATLLMARVLLGKSPLSFLVGVDNRYSNSQTQLALWFVTVATVYGGAVVLRMNSLGADFIGGVGIPENLLALTGLSALSFGGAKAIAVQKTQGDDAVPKTTADKPSITDLVQNDHNKADLGDFQMILITLAAVAIFFVTAFHFLGELPLAKTVSLPDVDSTLLSSFGLGQGAYLFKKAVVPTGDG